MTATPGRRRGWISPACAAVLLQAGVISAWAQAPEAPPGTTLHAGRASAPISVDGRLDEPDWQRAPVAGGFRQRDPDQGQPATEPTELRLLFDDHALYVGARLADDAPDRVVRQLSRRDAVAEADSFTLYLDPHRDRRTGVVLQVSAAGVQRDAAIYDDNFEDDTWDAVWESAVALDGAGWSVEMRIPFSQLRFPRAARPRLGRQRPPRRLPQERELVARPRAEERERPRVAHGGARGHRGHRARTARGAAALRVRSRGVRRPSLGRRSVQRRLASLRRAPASTSGSASATRHGARRAPSTRTSARSRWTRPWSTSPRSRRSSRRSGRSSPRAARSSCASGAAGPATTRRYFYPEPQLFYSRRIGRAPQGSATGDFVDTPAATTILGAAKLVGRTTKRLERSACWRP